MEEEFAAVMPEAPGTDLVVENRERRYIRKHARVIKKLRALPAGHGGGGGGGGNGGGEHEGEETAAAAEEIPGDFALATGDWDLAAQAAARRPGVPGRVDDVLQRLFAAGQPRSTTPLPGAVSYSGDSSYSLHDNRGGPSGKQHSDPNVKLAKVYSSHDDDDDDDEESEPVSRKRGRNPFVLDEAAEADNDDDDDDNDEDDEVEDCSLEE